MRSSIASSFRILGAVVVGLGLLLGVLVLVLRQPSWGAWPLQQSSRANPERLRADVVFLTTEVGPRDFDNPESLALAADYIRQEFEAAGAKVSELTFDSRDATYRNVIATFGSGPHPEIVVGAHYDAFGLLGHNPGADDNASGTAGLLELARLLDGLELDSRVDLVAYPNEEPPAFASSRMGSAVHAKYLRQHAGTIWGMVCLEMIGYYTEEQLWPNWLYGLLYPNRGDFIVIVGRWQDRQLVGHFKRSMRSTDVRPYSFTPPASLGGIDASDHRSYWNEGFGAIMVTDTAFMRNPNYHTPNDTAETLDYERMAQVVDGVLNAVVRAAKSRGRCGRDMNDERRAWLTSVATIWLVPRHRRRRQAEATSSTLRSLASKVASTMRW